MPTPEPNETQDDFMKRCIPMVVDDGSAGDNEQAVAMCMTMFKQQHSEATKAGARHSATDQKHIQAAHDAIVTAGAMCQPDAMPMKAASLDMEYTEYNTPELAIKANSDMTLDVCYMPYSGQNGGKDADMQYFSPRTNEHATKFTNPLVLYYHGYKARGVKQPVPVEIGHEAGKRWTDQAGRWMKVKLDETISEAVAVWQSAQKGLARASSDSISHLVRVAQDGEILNWPLVGISLFETETGKRPANSYAYAMPSAKALGINIPDDLETPSLDSGDNAREAAGHSAIDNQPSTDNQKGTKMSIDLKDPEVQAAMKTMAAEALAESQAADKAKLEAEAAVQARIDNAVKAATEPLVQQVAASQRLPFGRAPIQARFADTNRYEHYSASDLAMLIKLQNDAAALRRPGASGASVGAMKALAAKIAEGNDVTARNGREALKAIGVDPAAALDATKANELNYTTQVGYGDEFVPTVYSTEQWELIRKEAQVMSNIPGKEYTGPGDTVQIPVEGADPTFYRVGQATDNNATTGIPDSTIGSSKVATAKDTLTFAKIGTRPQYSGEFDEDSLIEWVPELRRKVQVAFKEQVDHLVIDGDTETGATTNINHIGGTPTSTGASQDLFLTLDGFRKLALVTNTANSRSASGSLVDTDFLNTVKLLGGAGQNADPAKCAFIVDGNVFWKVQEILSVKTQDVFKNATLENGMFASIWGYRVIPSWFMHWRSTTNPRKANTAGKVDLTTQANNTTGAILAVRWDQWHFGWKRNINMILQNIPNSDSYQMVVTARVGMIYRDVEASAITYNVGI